MTILNGKYTLIASDNFQAYLREIGVPEDLVEAGSDTNVETEISQNGDDYVIITNGGGKTIETKFKLNEEFDETLPHGVTVKTVVTRNGDKLIQTQKGGIESFITREFHGDELTVTMKAGSVVCTRNYVKAD